MHFLKQQLRSVLQLIIKMHKYTALKWQVKIAFLKQKQMLKIKSSVHQFTFHSPTHTQSHTDAGTLPPLVEIKGFSCQQTLHSHWKFLTEMQRVYLIKQFQCVFSACFKTCSLYSCLLSYTLPLLYLCWLIVTIPGPSALLAVNQWSSKI